MKNIVLWVLLSLIMVFSSCLSRKGEAPRFYVLERPAELGLFQKDSLLSGGKGLALLHEITINPAFGMHQIALREKSHEIRYFSFNQWAVRPQEGLFHVAMQRISESGIFEEVSHRFFAQDPDYYIFIHVNNLEVIEQKNEFEARLSTSWELIHNKSGTRHVHLELDDRLSMRRRDLNLFSQNISQMFVAATDQFLVETQNLMLSEQE